MPSLLRGVKRLPRIIDNQAHRGSWMLYGHSHGNLTDIGGKTIDVGVDCFDYYPVSLD